jgi:hypothetical protein
MTEGEAALGSITAIWTRLDTPGHDAAILTRTDEGYSLRGTAVFLHEQGPACVGYAVDLDAAWMTISGEVHGFRAGGEFHHVIRRERNGWRLNGDPVLGLEHLVDLDYGFTPATNLQQLRRIVIASGQSAEVPVAWFDIDSMTLTKLPQRYERRGEAYYWYLAPSIGYEGLLELAPNGFVRSYPNLWRMED